MKGKKDIKITDISKRLEYLDSITYQLITILNVLHDRGIIHNDITSKNIMLDINTMQIYLIDFGLSIQSSCNFLYNLTTDDDKTDQVSTGLVLLDYIFDII